MLRVEGLWVLDCSISLAGVRQDALWGPQEWKQSVWVHYCFDLRGNYEGRGPAPQPVIVIIRDDNSYLRVL